jgi:hypothetical protein
MGGKNSEGEFVSLGVLGGKNSEGEFVPLGVVGGKNCGGEFVLPCGFGAKKEVKIIYLKNLCLKI